LGCKQDSDQDQDSFLGPGIREGLTHKNSNQTSLLLVSALHVGKWERQHNSGDSGMKKGGSPCGPRRKVGGGNVNVSHTWRFFVVMKIDLL